MTEHKKKSIGKRIKSVRGYTALSRKRFCNKHGFSEATLKSWESGLTVIREGSLDRLLMAFEQEKILCSKEWLREGAGAPPYKMNQLEKLEPQAGDVAAEVDFFLQNNSESVVMQVEDEQMRPFYEPGDFIGGLEVRPSDLGEHKIHGILVNEEGRRSARCLTPVPSTGDYLVTAANPLVDQGPDPLSKIPTKTLYKIVWHRKGA